jgi:uncharacterized lipoprotein YehR (DUF1307 family)
MATDSKAHAYLDTDISEYIQKLSARTGISVSRCVNQLLRMIKSAEQTNTVTLNERELKGKEGKETVRFRKVTSIKIDI